MSQMSPMSSPLLEALVSKHGFQTVSEKTVDEFLSSAAHSVLFFAGDAGRLVETADVAVILPEILKAFKGAITPALVERAAERPLQLRYRFNAFPALVFSRRDGYLGVLTGILDWQDYLREIEAILARPISEPPPFTFPEGCLTGGARAGSGEAHDH